MLYHISLKKHEGKKLVFTPRIPPETNRLSDENITIPRICFSDSISGCLNAIKDTILDDVIMIEKSKVRKFLFMYME